MQKPTIGRIVFYKATNRDSEPKPAMILSVNGDKVDLNVQTPGKVEYVRNATQAESFETAEGGQWAWPERV